MPRPKKPGAPEPKKRSRNGCWPCKNRKVKCDEGHPQCDNCQKAHIECDYSVRLNWLGDGNYRPTKKKRPDEISAALVSVIPVHCRVARGKTMSAVDLLAAFGAFAHDIRVDTERLGGRAFSGLGPCNDHVRATTPETATFYGYDNGQPDRDLGQNDDSNAIVGYSPTDSRAGHGSSSDKTARESHPSDFGFGMRETGNYYEKRVEVWISKELEPLPPKLRQNPMNLLYFHHFLNHTARVLVPHDDPQSNPFRTVLPQMAVKHDNLLSLLLAYSASHRARHLRYPQPSLRIAHLVQGVIADLRSLVQQSMNKPETIISTADLAAAIMLASLEIISPAAIGGSIPWHHHLNLARELISRMPDGLRRVQGPPQEHCVRSLLWSWFAYLDVLGSLSGGPATLLTPSCYTTGGGPLSPAFPHPDLSHPNEEDEDTERIDCILGFTPRCVFILARIAELARHCEQARLRSSPAWGGPDAATRAAAASLETAALRSLAAPSRPCGHVHAASPLRRWDRTQMAAANRAFHHAALIHLHRRVLGKRSSHPDVRGAAQSVLECLEHVERGSSAELCLLFPMFTAGCELVDPVERGAILERVVSVERTGMVQVQRARKLMEKVWETGQPWETLVDAEFIG
ncbi:Acriflavine sensitivity control protein acr-2 [Coniochaeta hoffmannii]|uniref:Acriflavine sensitivity control protein acr-2 n=1 Tax=Coniochaeta hoffmannii TaxID=91930 RepID=A0AA38S5Q9_9PEZI|nr:Acriflavine sensitivity control protein acr-2 [Coniochaeta hoffmannii]